MLKSISKEWNEIIIPQYKGEVSMLPFDLANISSIPEEFKKTVLEMISKLPIKEGIAFLTVHGKFVKKDKTLRRGLPHIDGNYIKNFSSWGKSEPPIPDSSWGKGGGGGWKVGQNGPQLSSLEHKISYENENGGMLIASNYSACKGWNGSFEGKANVGGDCSHINLGEGFLLKANTVYYGNSQFIHESLPLDKDVFRTLFRITLPLDYKQLKD